MTTAELKTLIKDLRDQGTLRISFSGGEPLLRPDLAEIIGFTKGLGLGITLNSNGILVPLHLDTLKRLDTLAISLDGRPEHHDILRGPGTGVSALKGAEAAAQAGIPVHLNMVIHKYNIRDIDYMLEVARRIRARVEFNIAISNIFGAGTLGAEIRPSNDQIRDALRLIIIRKKAGAPILFSARAYESVLRCWDDFSKEGVFAPQRVPGMPRCPAGVFFCLIDSDGTLWACPHLIGKIKADNALAVGVRQAWATARSHPCRGCYQVYHHEFARLIGLDPQVLFNYAGK
jgi:MoaA/NifB/PqqE/SkfB family radical SAM enzyme